VLHDMRNLRNSILNWWISLHGYRISWQMVNALCLVNPDLEGLLSVAARRCRDRMDTDLLLTQSSSKVLDALRKCPSCWYPLQVAQKKKGSEAEKKLVDLRNLRFLTASNGCLWGVHNSSVVCVKLSAPATYSTKHAVPDFTTDFAMIGKTPLIINQGRLKYLRTGEGWTDAPSKFSAASAVAGCSTGDEIRFAAIVTHDRILLLEVRSGSKQLLDFQQISAIARPPDVSQISMALGTCVLFHVGILIRR